MKASLKTRSIRALVRMYPSAWRQEYGEEMEALLATEGLSLATLADVSSNAVRQRLRCGRPEMVPGAALLLWALFWTAWNSLAPLSPRAWSLFSLTQWFLFPAAYFATGYLTTSGKSSSVWRGAPGAIVVFIIGIAPELMLIALHVAGLIPIAVIDLNGVAQGRGITLLYERGTDVGFSVIPFIVVVVGLVAGLVGLLGALAGRLRSRLVGGRL